MKIRICISSGILNTISITATIKTNIKLNKEKPQEYINILIINTNSLNKDLLQQTANLDSVIHKVFFVAGYNEFKENKECVPNIINSIINTYNCTAKNIVELWSPYVHTPRLTAFVNTNVIQSAVEKLGGKIQKLVTCDEGLGCYLESIADDIKHVSTNYYYLYLLYPNIHNNINSTKFSSNAIDINIYKTLWTNLYNKLDFAKYDNMEDSAILTLIDLQWVHTNKIPEMILSLHNIGLKLNRKIYIKLHIRTRNHINEKIKLLTQQINLIPNCTVCFLISHYPVELYIINNTNRIIFAYNTSSLIIYGPNIFNIPTFNVLQHIPKPYEYINELSHIGINFDNLLKIFTPSIESYLIEQSQYSINDFFKLKTANNLNYLHKIKQDMLNFKHPLIKITKTDVKYRVYVLGFKLFSINRFLNKRKIKSFN